MESKVVTLGPCAKKVTKCTLVTPELLHIVGENWCLNPQPECPREPDEDYKKCKIVCGQIGHAEEIAVLLAGDLAKGSAAYLEGHTYACMKCQHALFGAGVKSLSVGPPEEAAAP